MLSKQLQQSYWVSIIALVLISLFSSLSGLSLHYSIANGWDGLLWGIADPVLHFNSLVNILSIGFISAGVANGGVIIFSLLLATTLGLVTHLLQFNLPGAEIAIAICGLWFGTVLILPQKPHWIILTLLAAIAGLSSGYLAGQSISDAAGLPVILYTFSIALTQYAVVATARQIIYQSLSSIIRFLGFTVVAIGIVFCGHYINYLGISNF